MKQNKGIVIDTEDELLDAAQERHRRDIAHQQILCWQRMLLHSRRRTAWPSDVLPACACHSEGSAACMMFSTGATKNVTNKNEGS